MRFLWTMGRFTVFDFTIFEIQDPPEEDADVVVVHHKYTDEEEEDKGPGDMFGGAR